MPQRGKTVYSTGPAGSSSTAKDKRNPREPAQSRPVEKQTVVIRHERAGRKGKCVTVCAPFRLVRGDASDLHKRLKKLCGGGGTLRLIETSAGEPAFALELQGEHAVLIEGELSSVGYRVKISGV